MHITRGTHLVTWVLCVIFLYELHHESPCCCGLPIGNIIIMLCEVMWLCYGSIIVMGLLPITTNMLQLLHQPERQYCNIVPSGENNCVCKILSSCIFFQPLLLVHTPTLGSANSRQLAFMNQDQTLYPFLRWPCMLLISFDELHKAVIHGRQWHLTPVFA